jgi:hypothetical protein
LGGSELTSISTAHVTRSARAAHTKEVPDRRKEGGVEDIDKNGDGGKKQKALGSDATVAVECIFSGGHDTITLHHTSLKSETIQVLMLVKHHLCLAQERAVKLVDLIDG